MLRNSFRDLQARIAVKPLRRNAICQCICMLSDARKVSYSSNNRDRSPHRKNQRGRVVQKSPKLPKLKHGSKLSFPTGHDEKPTEVELEELFKPVFPEPVKKSSEADDIGEQIAGKLTKSEKGTILRSFVMDKATEMLASQQGIEGNIYEVALQSFRKYCIDSTQLPVELHIVFRDLAQNVGHVSDLFPFFLGHAKTVFPHIDCMEDLQKISDLTEPSQWYPLARTMQRKIIYHAGPTNSGKTYHALKRFMESDSGVYCGPLRLLAMEVFDKCNTAEVPCDLITGETRRFAQDDETPSEHVACTVEMANLNQEYEVAVIDEIQMISDLQRGWSWTRTLLGIAAKEVHVCGEETAIDLVQNLTDSIGDSLEIRRYERLTSLTYLDEAVGSFDKVKEGDCIVCFSKKDIFKVFNVLMAKGHKCAVIYGDLPPGTKIMQSRKFNDPDDPCSVLVATDAVGMGLNLAIKRVVFYSIIKRSLREDHTFSMDYLSTSQAQQIGGRAGRFRTQYEDGEVTTFWRKDLDHLHKIVDVQKLPLEKAGMNPTAEMIEMFSFHLPKASLSNLIDIFVHVCKLDDLYFMCNLMQFKELAELIEHIPLPLKTRYTLCSSPLKVRKGFAQVMFVKIAMQMSKGFPLQYGWLCQTLGAPFSIPRSVSELEQLEGAFDVVDIYLWLSYRYPDLFVDADEVRQLRVKLDAIIQAFLNRGRIAEKKRRKIDLSNFDEQKAAETTLEEIEQDLIKNNPLQAYTPKPKPKKDSEKHRVLTDVYKELDEIERGIVEPEKVKTLYANTRATSKEDIQHKNAFVDDLEDMEKGEENIVIEDTADSIDIDKDNKSKLWTNGFLSKDNEMYNEIAGSYQIKSMFEKKTEDTEKTNKKTQGKRKCDKKFKNHSNAAEDIKKHEKTPFGMEEEELNQFKDMFNSVNTMKKEAPTFGLKEEELNQFKELLTSMKKITKTKKGSLNKMANDNESLGNFVHIYPRKQIKKLTDDFQISENEGLHESDSILSFSERFAILSKGKKLQNLQPQGSELHKDDEIQSANGSRFEDRNDNGDNCSRTVTDGKEDFTNEVNKFQEYPNEVKKLDIEQSRDENKNFEYGTESSSHNDNFNEEKGASPIDLSERTKISAESEEIGSLEEKLVRKGILTEEMLEKLKAEWEKKQDMGQISENDKNKNGIER